MEMPVTFISTLFILRLSAYHCLIYRNHVEMIHFLRNLSSSFQDLTHLYSIGNSVEGKELYVIAIAGYKPDVHVIGRPEVTYIANMHGNEAVGREMLLLLADYVLNEYRRNQNSEIRSLLDTTRVHLMPTMNPDGFQLSQEGVCDGLHGRNNVRGVDLNRDFPSFWSVVTKEDLEDREPETVAVMKWLDSVPFVLAANFHGGALVTNYPFDSSIGNKRGYSQAPDDDVLRYISVQYAQNHIYMNSSTKCDNDRIAFDGGITNGANWYPAKGSLQDYQYAFKGTMATTIEISCCKFPVSSTLDEYWLINRSPMISYWKAANLGVKGQILDESGNGLVAELQIKDREIKFKSSPKDGEFHRILLPGSYSLVVKALKYEAKTVDFRIPPDLPLITVNVTLTQLVKRRRKRSIRT